MRNSGELRSIEICTEHVVSSEHISKIRIFFVREILKREFVSVYVIQLQTVSSSILPYEYKIQSSSRYYCYAVANTLLAPRYNWY